MQREITMHTYLKINTILLPALIFSATAYAALPPHVQNQKDLKVMEAFVESYTKVSSTFVRIDLYTKEVHFGKNCVASFARKASFHLPGWVGPAADLEFKSATCPIE